ncbi:hypothetical protein CEXT_66831 [Caerostris extrusa]|uniref:Uncharacterized protein n=1 Tax=Caerostris extrusa TaxID=172846 RepID=A0AAV4QKH6_CAEEX|nr:hypothetical protein CEXT_66831 [Caerostris extrusa]
MWNFVAKIPLPSLTNPEIIPPGLLLLPPTPPPPLTVNPSLWKLEALRRESDRLGRNQKITEELRRKAPRRFLGGSTPLSIPAPPRELVGETVSQI